MHSNFSAKSLTTFAFVVLLSATSCGQIDSKDKTLIPQNDIGCFDKLGERVSRYFDGNIEVAEWEDTFNCVNDQVTFFKKYVRGSVPNGYDQADIGALVRRFLIVKRPVSNQFISSIFDIKSSVFGGETNVITMKQVDEFLKLSEVLRKETVALLPSLQAKKRTPSSATLLKLSDDLGVFGAHLGSYLGTLNGSTSVDKTSFLPFVREIIIMHGGDETLVDRYGDFVRNLKVVVTGGSPDLIEPKAWPVLIREGISLSGLLLARREMGKSAFSGTDEEDLLDIELVDRLQTIANRVISRHGAGIPLEIFDPVIDTYPADALTPVKRLALKKDLRPIVTRALKGGAAGWLTPKAVSVIVDLFQSGMRSQVHLKRIYQMLPVEPSRKDFEIAARKYQLTVSSIQAITDVAELIEISKTYVGLFPENSSQMVFTNSMREIRTRNHMIRMAWFKLIIKHAFSVYATGPSSANKGKSAQTIDLAELSTDFLNVLKEWKMAHPLLTPMEMAIKRFREGNLFMPTSNGDAYFDPVEATYYVAFLFSSGSLSSDIFRKITQNSPNWSMCPIVGVDELGQEAVEANCFRKVYFGNPSHFWGSFPALLAAYTKMSPAQKADLAYSMEQAARRGGYSEMPIGPYDTDSFAALPHYVENIMERFDANDNEVLDRDEILKNAFPIFRDTLSAAAGGKKSNTILKGILTYIIRYGKQPNTVQLLAWLVEMPFVKIEASRSDLYKVVSLISTTKPAPKPNRSGIYEIDRGVLFPTVVTTSDTAH